MNKKIIVTGGAGFIGSHVVDRLLSEGDEVVVVDNLSYAGNLNNLKLASGHKKYLAFHKEDITNTNRILNLMLHHKIDLIINLAAETHVDNSINDCNPFIHSNIIGVTSLLECCKKLNVPLCHISTDEVYGPADPKGVSGFLEHEKLSPQNPYAATKASAEHMIKSYANTYGVKYMILRPSNNYGPRQHREKFLPKLINSIKHNKQFPLYGDGAQQREWLYVKDNAAFIAHLAKLGKWNIDINLGTGQMFKNVDMIQQVSKQMSNPHDLGSIIQHVEDRPGHDKCYWINTSLLQSFLPVSFKQTPLHIGLSDTIKFYEEK
jgi:dTDP-glucose 4,6-dehydratase